MPQKTLKQSDVDVFFGFQEITPDTDSETKTKEDQIGMIYLIL